MDALFEFRQCITLLKATGAAAKNLRELRDLIATAGDACLHHHMYQYFLKGHILEYTNDFAQWAGQYLEERALAEELSNVDPYGFNDIDSLRRELIRVIDDYLKRFPEPRDTRPGEGFYFNETVTLVFPAGVRAKNLAEFVIAVKYVDASSLYYHFFDARQRLGGKMNDFSEWLSAGLNKQEIADKLMKIDPFVLSLEGIRERIIAALEEELKQDMETAGVAREAADTKKEREPAGVHHD